MNNMVMVTGDEPVHGVHLLRNKLSTPMQSTAADISQSNWGMYTVPSGTTRWIINGLQG
ncbi:hypothetical protein MHB56_21455 [Paenibacillus sp. FSL H8-0315]